MTQRTYFIRFDNVTELQAFRDRVTESDSELLEMLLFSTALPVVIAKVLNKDQLDRIQKLSGSLATFYDDLKLEPTHENKST